MFVPFDQVGDQGTGIEKLLDEQADFLDGVVFAVSGHGASW
jgi:hypothetical protein